jgi:hypothetical protein
MKIRLFFLTSVAFCLFATHIHATELGFFVGGVKPGTISFQNVKTSLDSSPIFGFRLANNFVPHFGMEHTLAFSSDYLFPRGISAIKDAKGFVYNSNLIINIPLKVVTPYLTAGAGLMHQYGDLNLPVGTKFALNYGGGLKFPRVAGPLGLRFDVRGYSAGLIMDKLNILEVSGGIMLSFGK